MHITGGAFTKLKDILPKTCDAHVNIPANIKHIDFWQDVAKHVNTENIAEFFTTLNWGIGMIIAIPSTRSIPKDSVVVGHVSKGTGKVIVKPPHFMNYEKVQL
jgi:phosphoribosylaminoimidazole (AIR) synthetase